MSVFKLSSQGSRWNGYRGFIGESHLLDTVPSPPKPFTKVKTVAKHWSPPTMIRHQGGEPKDFTQVNLGTPVFSQKAVNALGEMLSSNGELLPIAAPDGYLVFNVTMLVNALNASRSDIQYHRNSKNILFINRFVFKKMTEKLTIFRVPATRGSIYVTSKFVNRCVENKLRGFNFDLIWPLPENTHWMDIRREKRQAKADSSPQS